MFLVMRTMPHSSWQNIWHLSHVVPLNKSLTTECGMKLDSYIQQPLWYAVTIGVITMCGICLYRIDMQPIRRENAEQSEV